MTAAARIDVAPPLLALSGISKAFGATFANRELSASFAAGETVGLIGANGAGKSTLMRIVAGITQPDSGEMRVAERDIDTRHYTPAAARRLGIRLATQELSLCNSLSVVENFLLEVPRLAGRGPFWRRHLARFAAAAIEDIFPASGIDVRAPVRTLPIAQRQMVEIARAASDPDWRLLILDEPTSSLDARRSAGLRTWIRRQTDSGRAVVFISHKLHEVATVADRILVMRGGRFVATPPGRLDVAAMVALMIGDAPAALARERRASRTGRVLVETPGGPLHAGEIVGLAGLEGNGQRSFLHALFDAAASGAPRKWHGGDLRCHDRAAFVSGDRVREGNFPLWSVRRNASLAALAARGASAWLRDARETALVRHWLNRVQLDMARIDSPIVELSGGNQQKVLLGRALMTEAPILLLDDPTRGVDVGVKRAFYRLIGEAAESGTLVVWHSSEDIEFLECSRVLVFRDDAITQTLLGSEISEEAIVGAAFQERLDGGGLAALGGARRDLGWLAPPAVLLAMAVVIASLNGSAASLLGVDLLVTAAVPLLLLSLAQMFVIGGSEIDLGIGTFAGLVNVLSATFLVDHPPVGIAALAGALAAYVLLGMLIRLRRIPAIVVTLGASFVWQGLGYWLQPTPGGSSPGWLTDAAAATPLGLPISLWTVAAATLLAAALNASRVGTVLRGFGANPIAMQQAGWSPLLATAGRYLISGSLALVAGLAMTAINTASDIFAGSTYTLLSVAATVVGGCAITGGRIAPVGVACGALTLSLIGSLLGFLGVSTDYNAAVQGGLLIATLGLRGRRA